MIKFLKVLALFILSNSIFAHGEDKFGPNNGYIRMPGFYHVELVPKTYGFEVFLHDVNNKNSTTQDSLVSLLLEKDNKKIEIPCNKNSISFICENNQNLPFLSGKLIVESTRLGSKGSSAIYSLPLSFKVIKKDNAHLNH